MKLFILIDPSIHYFSDKSFSFIIMKRQKFLKNNEKIIRDKWGKEKFNVSVPYEFDIENKKKFFVTFPFPYMNGKLHLGRVFSLLKADVMARHHLLRGYNVLFPFGFHATGIPICAAANRLKLELIDSNAEKK